MAIKPNVVEFFFTRKNDHPSLGGGWSVMAKTETGNPHEIVAMPTNGEAKRVCLMLQQAAMSYAVTRTRLVLRDISEG